MLVLKTYLMCSQPSQSYTLNPKITIAFAFEKCTVYCYACWMEPLTLLLVYSLRRRLVREVAPEAFDARGVDAQVAAPQPELRLRLHQSHVAATPTASRCHNHVVSKTPQKAE